MGWAFARINNRLAEIYFDGRKIIGHCYVKKTEYTTKKELRWIEKDTKKFRFTYQNGKYQKLDLTSYHTPTK